MRRRAWRSRSGRTFRAPRRSVPTCLSTRPMNSGQQGRLVLARARRVVAHLARPMSPIIRRASNTANSKPQAKPKSKQKQPKQKNQPVCPRSRIASARQGGSHSLPPTETYGYRMPGMRDAAADDSSWVNHRRPRLESTKILIAELKEWDLRQSLALGFHHDGSHRCFLSGWYRRDSAPKRGGRGTSAIAMDASVPAGCAAFRRLGPGTCELYDVYVRPGCRGRGIGSTLVRRLLSQASAAGYEAMCLETASFMLTAHNLYLVAALPSARALPEPSRTACRRHRVDGMQARW